LVKISTVTAMAYTVIDLAFDCRFRHYASPEGQKTKNWKHGAQ